MASQREIAKQFGCVPSYVAKLVKKGMPTDSIAEATKFREENTGWRSPTDEKSIRRLIGDNRATDSPQAKTFIPLAVARARAFRGYEMIFDLVFRLPRAAAALCNPGDPQMAIDVLERECTIILVEAHDAYALWPPD